MGVSTCNSPGAKHRVVSTIALQPILGFILRRLENGTLSCRLRLKGWSFPKREKVHMGMTHQTPPPLRVFLDLQLNNFQNTLSASLQPSRDISSETCGTDAHHMSCATLYIKPMKGLPYSRTEKRVGISEGLVPVSLRRELRPRRKT